MKKVLITGGSGLLGERLTDILLQRGYHVSHLGRSKHNNKVPTFIWDISRRYVDPNALNDVDTIVHLAGAGIADKRWTEERKKEIRQSRVDSTRLLFDVLNKGGHSVKNFVSASAIGYYGFDNDDKFFHEDDEAGEDFLGRVTLDWETEVDKLRELGLRIVKIRTGIVLTLKGGVLKELMRTVKFLVGAPLGSGQQYISWIHIDDHSEIVIKAIEDTSMHGAYNSVAPNPVTNAELTKMIADVMHKPLWLPNVPAFVLRLVLGEMANLVLYSSKVSPDKIIRSGYTFKFDNAKTAIRDLVERKV